MRWTSTVTRLYSSSNHPLHHAVYEYDGDRSASSLHAFAVNSQAGLANSGHRRRGYLERDGTVHQSLVDLARRVPADAGEILSFALATSPAAALLIAMLVMTTGALIAMAVTLTPAAAPSSSSRAHRRYVLGNAAPSRSPLRAALGARCGA